MHMLQGYEGEGGLHALLHGRGWVSSLSAGPAVSGSDFTLFRLTMTLTEEGERHTDEIVELCHRFLALLRQEPPQKRIQVCLCVCVRACFLLLFFFETVDFFPSCGFFSFILFDFCGWS